MASSQRARSVSRSTSPRRAAEAGPGSDSQATLRKPPLASTLVVAGLFLIYLATASHDQRQSIDPLSTLVPAWDLARHGTVYSDSYAGFSPWFVEVHGHIISNRLPGAILAATPFYFLLGRGGEHAPIYPAAVASAFLATLLVVAVYRVCARLTTPRVGLGAAAVFALATPTWLVSADGIWTHGPAQLGLALGLLGFSRGRLASGGLAQGFAILCRPHLAVVPACMGLAEGWRRRSIRPVLVVGLTSGLGLAALFIYYRLVYGQWTLSGGYGALGGYDEAGFPVRDRLDGLRRVLPNIAGSLVSPARGLLVYSPFLLLLLPGLRAAWRAAPSWARSASVGGLAYALVQLWNNGFDGGEHFFGYRLLLEPLTLATPLLVLAYVRWTALRLWRLAAFWTLTFLTVAWQLAASLSVPYFTVVYHPWQTLLYAEVARQRPWLLGCAVVLALVAAAVVTWRASTGPRDDADASSPHRHGQHLVQPTS